MASSRISRPLSHVKSQEMKSSTDMSPPLLSAGVEVEESTEARIARLGRERPAQFKSAWSELGFLLSVFTAQIMAVSLLRTANLQHITDSIPKPRSWLITSGIFHIGIHDPPPHPGFLLEPLLNLHNMACNILHLNVRRLVPPLRSPLRPLFITPHLYLRSRLVLHLVPHRLLLPQ